MSVVAPYGSWVSPISAADLVSSGHPVSGGCFVGDEIWWLEARPDEDGRLAVRRIENGEPADVLPPPWNARTRVHEYGGGAWTTTKDGTLVFAEYTDQRLYRLAPGATEPVPLTPADQGMRFAELSIRDSEVIAVRETHGADRVARDIVAVPLDGSAEAEAGGIRSIVRGSRFLAYPRISPDGSRIAWIAWQHPQMPWDGTELRVGELEDGVVTRWRILIGGKSESVLQPEWVDDDALYAISDRSGWWNLYRIDAGGLTTALHPIEADMGGALWQLGARWYSVLDDGSLLSVRTHGTDRLAVLEFSTGEFRDIDLPFASITLGGVKGDRLLTVCGGPAHPAGLRDVSLTDGAVRDVRLSVDELPDADYLPAAEPSEFGGVPVVVYRPRNAEYSAPDAELPPFVAFVHGGPTAHVTPSLSLSTAYFTSRGIGVLEVNYGGSTGFGRAWRDRLKLQWGVVDVADTVGAMRALADAGIADPARLAIRGGSAGGLTVLAALEESDVFACGTSYYGVADLAALAADMHDFEARYLDGLVGPLPEAAEVYRDRSPLGHVDRLSVPVLLLQGLDDPVVPPSQSETLRDALVSRGIPHAYVAYEGETHGFRRSETIIHSAQAELSFYGQVMGFEPPGTPALELWRP